MTNHPQRISRQEQAEQSLVEAIRQAELDPANTKWQRELSVRHDRLADVLLEQSEMDKAVEAYQTSISIVAHLLEQYPDDVECKRELADRHDRLGDVLRRVGKVDAAIDEYRESVWHRDGLSIIARLAKRTAQKLQCQHDMAIAHEKIGDVQRDRGDNAGALAAYQTSLAFRMSLAIQDRLAEQNAMKSNRLSDLAASHRKIGEVLLDQGNTSEALDAFRASWKITDRLAEAMESADLEEVEELWRRTYEKLASTKREGFRLSAADEEFLEQLKKRFGT